MTEDVIHLGKCFFKKSKSYEVVFIRGINEEAIPFNSDDILCYSFNGYICYGDNMVLVLHVINEFGRETILRPSSLDFVIDISNYREKRIEELLLG